ncbi:Ku protein [Paenibacillus thalictri]|uniref:non-homologous end joining protein Ku n=1 Tax=Paenibacillus thalictri TaxID=2527873 RepID=UPI0013EF422B|nr:Ku protein [Paenibacillus thalictri]
MHTIWKGAITFGLVHVPVKMYTAVEEKDIAMKQIHHECGSSISNVRSCPNCKREVAWEEIVKGYEYDKGKYVLFTKEELEQLLPESDKTIRILHFVDMDEVDPVYYQKTYYLSPGDMGEKGYSLLLQALKSTNKTAVCKVALRSKIHLALLRTAGECIVLETLYYPDEVRPVAHVPNMPDGRTVDNKELKLAQMLIGQLSGPFDASQYKDDFRLQLIDAIQRKIQGEEIRVQPTISENGVMDLMSALQASLEQLNAAAQAEAATAKKRKKKVARVEETA